MKEKGKEIGRVSEDCKLSLTFYSAEFHEMCVCVKELREVSVERIERLR